MIDSIAIQQFRCFEGSELSFHNHRLDGHPSRLNVFYGENAHGKTSLLEAIHVLLTARSFRSSSLDQLIRNDSQGFLLRARLRLPEVSSMLRPSRIGLEKFLRKSPLVSVDGERLRSASKLATILPVQILDHDSLNIVFGEPARRRRFLDWGVFHVEPLFSSLIQDWRQVVVQRNAAIKSSRSRTSQGDSNLEAWTASYVDMSVSIARMRQNYLSELTHFLACGEIDAEQGQDAILSSSSSANKEFSTALDDLDLAGFDGRTIKLTLKHGFCFDPDSSDVENSRLFLNELHERKEAEFALGRTLSGPGRCDIVLRESDVPVKEHLSRGQGKLLAAQLLLGQMRHLEVARSQSPGVVLIDDLYSELDQIRADAVVRHATAGDAQLFIAVLASKKEEVPDNLRKLAVGSMFHVEHSSVSR